MTSEWVTIPGFDVYEAHPDGRIRRIGGNEVKPYISRRNGYAQCSTSIRGKTGTIRWHKLVALAFLGPRPDGMQINHKDGCKTNNRAENLEYCTQSQNMKHAYATGLEVPLRGEERKHSKLTTAVVLRIIELEGTATHSKIAAQFGTTRKNVAAIYSGFSWSHVTGRIYANRNRTIGAPRKRMKHEQDV